MVTSNQARTIALKKYPDFEVKSIVDYDDIYVLTLIPKNYDESKEGIFSDCFYSVAKSSGELKTFTPWTDRKFLDRFCNPLSVISAIEK